MPVLTPRLSSLWLDLVTAVPSNVARALIDGLEHDVLADDAALRALVPLRLMPYREAAQAAFDAERDQGAAAEGLAPSDAVEAGARADAATGSRWTEGSRRDPTDLAVGDTVDFWRVAALEPGHRLTLLAEMRMPGSASLAFEVHTLDERRSRITVTASFHPAGVKGLLYWHALTPAHALIFPGMARAIARRAERP